MGARALAGVVLAWVALWSAVGLSGEPSAPWPSGLAEAAAAYRKTLAAGQESVKGSSLKSSFGVEETVQFDLVTHACHRGPGQAWRAYGEPQLLSSAGAEARVQYSFELFFRQALTLEEMFQKPWREGSDGEIEVLFRRDGERWVAGSKKEVLSRKEGASGSGAGGVPDLGGKKGQKAK